MATGWRSGTHAVCPHLDPQSAIHVRLSAAGNLPLVHVSGPTARSSAAGRSEQLESGISRQAPFQRQSIDSGRSVSRCPSPTAAHLPCDSDRYRGLGHSRAIDDYRSNLRDPRYIRRMSEVGGATNQAGIYYQNCVAAMQLLELLDLRSVPARERVVAVRVEAPGDVDDIVVEHADGHRHFLSAKMSIRASGDAWDNMWADLRAEAAAATTRPDDQISIIVAERSTASDTVASLCTIALTSIDAAEFDGRLTETQGRILLKIGPTSTSLLDRYELLRRIEVIVHSEAEIEHAFASRRNEAISVAPATLLALLRDMAGGHARTRQSFRAPLLRRRLREEHGIAILEPLSGVLRPIAPQAGAQRA